jgi:hypothetical protein
MTIRSEDVEPTMARITGELRREAPSLNALCKFKLFTRCEAAKGTGSRANLQLACANLWRGIKGIEKIAVALAGAAGAQCEQ